MLKNKFGMTKILVLVLSVLMLVSLVACNKDDGTGINSDDLNSAIQAAVDAAKAEQEAKDAALQSSIAAAAAEQAAKDAALQSSIAADKAAQDAALKKAQEEAEAAKKAAAEASKQAAEASKAAAEASKDASKANTTTKAPATTTTKAPETTAPVVVDKTEVLSAYSKLKTEYTYTKRDMYLAADYEALVLLFDKASVDLNNAASVDAATAVLETLKVDVAAIENVETAAAKVQALIAALGDVETAVFTVANEKVAEADEALYDLLVKYDEYLDVEYDDDDVVIAYNAKTVKALGIKEADLDKAAAKIAVLKSYITVSLKEDMMALYDAFELDFDEEGDDMTDALYAFIKDAYYKYQVLAVVNGGYVAAADVAVDWDYLTDDNGKIVRYAAGDAYVHPWAAIGATYSVGDKVYDAKAPVAYFTAEEFIDVFATPYLNIALANTKTAAVNALAADLDAGYAYIASKVTNANYFAAAKDVEDAFEDIVDEFEETLEALSFVEDYKGNATLGSAQKDIWTLYAKAYVAGLNAITEASKEVAIEYYTEKTYEPKLESLEDKYSEERYQTAEHQAAYAKLVAQAQADFDAFVANVEAAPVYTFADLETAELREAFGTKDAPILALVKEYITSSGLKAELTNYAKATVVDSINKNFKTKVSSGTQAGLVGDVALAVVEDLLAFRDKLDPTDSKASIYTALKGYEMAYLDGSDYANGKYYSNIPAFEAMLEIIDKAIADIEAVSAENYTAKEINVTTTDGNEFGDKNNKKNLYWVNEAAKAYVEAEGYDHLWLFNQEKSSAPNLTVSVVVDGVAKTLKVHKVTEGALVYTTETCADGTHAKVTDYSAKTEADLLHAKYDEATESYVVCECEQTVSATSKIATYETIDTGRKITNSNLVGDYLTLNNTGLPLVYTRTAEEQAALAINDLYKKAIENVHKAIIALDTVNYASSYTNKITGTDQYKAILKNVGSNADLKAEVEAYAKVYTDYITTFTAYTYAIKGYSVSNIASSRTQILEAAGNVYFSNGTSINNASSKYALSNMTTVLEAVVKSFNDTFYTDSTKVASQVVELYNYKQEAIAYITETIEGYKNTYTTVEYVDAGVTKYRTTQNAGSYYVYDKDLTATSAAGKAFEAELDALLASYIAKINAVKLNFNSDIKDFRDQKIAAKADTKYPTSTSAGTKIGKWTISTAKKAVNAYVVDLLGWEAATGYTGSVTDAYESTEAAGTKYVAADGNQINTVDGRVFQAYKIAVNNDYSSILANLKDGTCSLTHVVVKN